MRGIKRQTAISRWRTVVLLNSGGDATQTAAILSGLTAEQSTIERALAMNWLAKYMATMPQLFCLRLRAHGLNIS